MAHDRGQHSPTKAAIKLHTLIDLRGSIPSFIHISNGKMADVRVLYLLTYCKLTFKRSFYNVRLVTYLSLVRDCSILERKN